MGGSTGDCVEQSNYWYESRYEYCTTHLELDLRSVHDQAENSLFLMTGFVATSCTLLLLALAPSPGPPRRRPRYTRPSGRGRYTPPDELPPSQRKAREPEPGSLEAAEQVNLSLQAQLTELSASLKDTQQKRSSERAQLAVAHVKAEVLRKALAEKDEDQEKALKKAVTVAKINAARAAGPSGRTAWPSRAQEV